MTHEFDKSGKLIEPSAEQLSAADGELDIIVLDSGIMEDGAPYWAYIAIKPSHYKEFMRMTRQGQPIILEEYGEILKHGFDEHVPLEAVDAMREEYGFDENYVEKLGKKLVEVQTVFIKQRENQRLTDIVAMMKKKQGS
ncbi:MAG: hypothetical protein EBR02_08045 [Alphaproteobacteria bacterium]|nr:hypothetical protein [Alphaproteobacteria bacterium]